MRNDETSILLLSLTFSRRGFRFCRAKLQVELFSTNNALKSVIRSLSDKGLGYRLACVHLVDSYLCTEPAKFMSAVTLSLSTMLHLELPHVNVLTKVTIGKHAPLHRLPPRLTAILPPLTIDPAVLILSISALCISFESRSWISSSPTETFLYRWSFSPRFRT